MRKFAPLMLLIILVSACVAGKDAAPTALEERVRQMEDEKEIRELLVRYGEFLDAKDYAGYASLFASDGVSTTGFGSATGPEAIQALLEQNMGDPGPGYINKNRFHLMTTMMVEVSGDTATARSRYTVFAASDAGLPIAVHSGRYDDELRRENGAWKIRTRTSRGVIPYRESRKPAAGGK